MEDDFLLRRKLVLGNQMAMAASAKCFLVTGPPSVGKTTLIARVLENLTTSNPNLKIQGFFTREIRHGGERVGFEVVTLDGRTAPLASINNSSTESIRWPTVGRYKVDVASLESLALPELHVKEETDLFVIDEVGKMELFSSSFFPAVLRVLESNKPFLATIPIPKSGRDMPAVMWLKNQPGATVFTLTKSNRDAMKDQIYSQLMDKLDGGSYRGVKLVSGQELTSNQLVMDPSFTIKNSSSDSPQDVSNVFHLGDVSGKLARGICLTKGSLKPGVTNCLVIYPPRTLYPEQATSIRVLQLGSNLAVCPSDMFVFYISVICDDTLEGKKSLQAAIDGLFSVHTSGTTDSTSTDQTYNTEVKPTLLWSALYIRDLIEGSMGPVVTTPTPDGNLNYNDLVGETLMLFQKLYPDVELFPDTRNPDSSDMLEDDTEVGLES